MKQLKHIFITLVLLLSFAFSNKVMAQRDKIEELRATFISKKLDMTASESDKFWPVYNEYQDKLKAIKRNLRLSYKNLPPNFTDKEAEEIIAIENKSKMAEAELTKTYNDKLKAIIGVKKLVKLQICEDEFKKEVLNALKEK